MPGRRGSSRARRARPPYARAVSAPDGEWASFGEAREAIETTPLRDLQARLGQPAPQLLPWSGLSLGAGLLLALAGGGSPALRALGALLAVYGLLAVVTNRSRAALYREGLYRGWVRARAEAMADELDAALEAERDRD